MRLILSDGCPKAIFQARVGQRVVAGSAVSNLIWH